jgi:hypothetical protein
MSNSVKLLAVLIGCLLPSEVISQECRSLASGSATVATEYIEHTDDNPDAASCVKLAFHQIAVGPPAESIPVLINFLSYKRPLNKGERSGIFMHGKGPSELYPAVHELGGLGPDAEVALIGFIPSKEDSNSLEIENALYAILLIHHGNVVGVIQRLRAEAENSDGPTARNRLKVAARTMLRWCDDRSRPECERALR